MFRKITAFLLASLLMLSLAGCADEDEPSESSAASSAGGTGNTAGSASDTGSEDSGMEELPDIEMRFGADGEPFILHLYDNATATELARSISSAGMNLPIYHYDDFEGYEVMQYYDIPDRFDIPSNPKAVTAVKAGEVYYSDPNRVILFYQDAEISGEYTEIGSIENIDGLKEAVENNPVAEGWSNKIIALRYAQ